MPTLRKSFHLVLQAMQTVMILAAQVMSRFRLRVVF